MTEIHFNKSENCYTQMARILLRRFSFLQEKSGLLPSYRELATEYGVSLAMIQRAFLELKKQNAVIPRQGHRLSAEAFRDRGPVMRNFGLIHPFHPDYSFGRLLYYFSNRAFESRGYHGSVSVCSSGGVAEKEIEIAENMCYNGIQGLLLSPADIQVNRDYFEGLAKKMPVVLLDQIFPGTVLPGVIPDYRKCGAEAVKIMRKENRTAKILALFEQNGNLSLVDCENAMREAAPDILIHKIPMLKILREMLDGHFTQAECCREEIKNIIQRNEIDGLFCCFNDFSADVLAVNGWFRQFPGLCLFSLGSTLNGIRSRDYFEIPGKEFRFSYPAYFGRAADLLMKWCVSSRAPTGIKKIQFQYFNRSGE